MKKILYILFTVSLLAVGCTKEVPVSRDYDIDAEVLDIKTNLEMKTLYCNLNESGTLDLQKLGEYLTTQNADVVMFVAPTTVVSVVRENDAVIGTQSFEFKTWLDEYAASQVKEEAPALNTVYARNADGRLIMAALVKAELELQNIAVSQRGILNNAVLHFIANGFHFVVTDLLPARNTMPYDWEDQVSAMMSAKKESPLVYDPDILATRKAELAEIFRQTYDNPAYIKDAYWIWAMSMNAESALDITKYKREFLRSDYYDSDPDFDWEVFYKSSKKYFTPPTETLLDNDPYFGVNTLMNYYYLVDCNAVHHSLYTPSGINDTRRNFLYASVSCWNLFQTFDFDTAFVTDEMQVAHYPMIVTLKREE